jgi:hypothetical protein
VEFEHAPLASTANSAEAAARAFAIRVIGLSTMVAPKSLIAVDTKTLIFFGT